MTYSLIKYRYREDEDYDGEPRQIHGNLKVETSLTIASFALVGIFGYLSIHTLLKMNPSTKNHKPDIIITGHQWWWEAKYTKTGAVTANEIHFPVGKRMLVEFKSADVIHDWWVPALGQKIDMFPSKTTHMWIKIEKPGHYQGTCAEYCGAQHAHMRIHVIAQSPKKFNKWEKHEAQPAAPPSSRMAALGDAVFSGKSCGRCHNIKGNPSANGDVGPDLTHIASRKTILTFVKNTPKNLHEWINHPQKMKEGAHMPGFKFNKKQLNAIVDYLEGLK